jgi:hypothetical protein
VRGLSTGDLVDMLRRHPRAAVRTRAVAEDGTSRVSGDTGEHQGAVILSPGGPVRSRRDNRGHTGETVRDREAPGSNPVPPTSFEFRIQRSRPRRSRFWPHVSQPYHRLVETLLASPRIRRFQRPWVAILLRRQRSTKEGARRKNRGQSGSDALSRILLGPQ